MALPKAAPVNDWQSDIQFPAPQRTGPVDLAEANIDPSHYETPEVSRLQEWAMQANAEITQESILQDSIKPLPVGTAFALMISASICLWALLAGGVSLIF